MIETNIHGQAPHKKNEDTHIDLAYSEFERLVDSTMLETFPNMLNKIQCIVNWNLS